jgi:HprK-related kinase B
VSAPAPIDVLARSIQADSPCPHLLRLDFAGFAVDVASNDERLTGALGVYFKEFLRPAGPASCMVTAVEAPAPVLPLGYALKPPEPGKEKIKEEFAFVPGGRVVRKRLTGMVFLAGGGINLAVGPCLKNPNQVVNFIASRFMSVWLDRGALLLHAAAVARNGRGIALAGFSGMGKSTLALHMMNLGLDFVSNDRLMVRREGAGLVMRGLPKHPRINPGTALHNERLAGLIPEKERGELLALPEERLWKLERKRDALVDECFGPGRFRLEADMAALAVLNWRPAGGAARALRVDLRSRRDLFPAFMKNPGLFYAPGEAAALSKEGGAAPAAAGAALATGVLTHPSGLEFPPEAYLDLLAPAVALEVSGPADFSGAARQLAELLDG